MSKPNKKKSIQSAKVAANAVENPVKIANYERYFLLILILFSFGLYFNTVFNDYALDDIVVVKQNSFTQKGFGGIKELLTNDTFLGYLNSKSNLVVGGRYRPLSVVSLAIEYQFFGENPHISHFINILLYALIVLVLYKVLSKILKNIKTPFSEKKWYFALPFLASLLFAAHPLHTEVVANIKGRDELMALLGALASLWFSLKFIENARPLHLLFSFILAFLGMMSKENALTFVAIVPLTAWFFYQTNWKKTLLATLPVVFAAIIFLVFRFKYLGTPTTEIAPNLMNNPFLFATGAEKYATIIYTWLVYIKLLIFPHPLTVDYYPYHIPLVSFADIRVILSILIFLALAIFAIISLKTKSLLSWCILFFALTFSIVSNLLFPIGTFMGERFVFFSSIGFCVAAAYLLLLGFQKFRLSASVFSGFVFLILILFSVKTISRNSQWKNDFTLFTHDVKISKESSFSTKSAGNHLIEAANLPENADKKQEYLKLAIEYLTKSVEIYPQHQKALWLLGNAHYLYNKNYGQALYYYGQLLNIDPNYNDVYLNIPVMFNDLKDSVDFKIRVWEDLYKIRPDRYDINNYLGILYRDDKQNFKKAIPYFEKCLKLRPNDANSLLDLGVCYGNSGDFKKALEIHLQGYKSDSTIFKLVNNLGIIYNALGDKKLSALYFEKSKKLKQ